MDEIVELHLRASPPTLTDSSTWKAVVLQLLRLISECASDSESKETVALRTRLSQHRQVLGGVLHPQEERQEASECVTSCEEYLRRVQLDAKARESELTDVVKLLRDATAMMIGESSDFHAEILSSTDRFKSIAGLDDLRDLKRQLSDEISSLERAVEAKKQRERDAMEALSRRVEVLQLDLGLAEERAALDPLTKLANRGTFDRALDRLIRSARASQSPLSLAMLDIDHFKTINDTHGHQVGDRVLLCMADWLRGSIRQNDVVSRYGGEEFAVIVGIDLRQAEERFTKLLQNIASRAYDYEEHGASKSISFTVSCGLSQLSDSDGAEDVIGRADQALYEAKHKGRNRVCVKKVSRLARLLGG
jgi:diguanylate cyclase (GGDEF)-like protein